MKFNWLTVRAPHGYKPHWTQLTLAVILAGTTAMLLLKSEPTVKPADRLNDAVMRNNTSLVLYAIRLGAPVDQRDCVGVTPLMMAAGYDAHREICLALLRGGADVNARAIGWGSPLMRAALFGERDIVKLLISYGADPALQNDRGQTAADYALMGDQPDLAQELRQMESAHHNDSTHPTDR